MAGILDMRLDSDDSDEEYVDMDLVSSDSGSESESEKMKKRKRDKKMADIAKRNKKKRKMLEYSKKMGLEIRPEDYIEETYQSSADESAEKESPEEKASKILEEMKQQEKDFIQAFPPYVSKSDEWMLQFQRPNKVGQNNRTHKNGQSNRTNNTGKKLLDQLNGGFVLTKDGFNHIHQKETGERSENNLIEETTAISAIKILEELNKGRENKETNKTGEEKLRDVSNMIERYRNIKNSEETSAEIPEETPFANEERRITREIIKNSLANYEASKTKVITKIVKFAGETMAITQVQGANQKSNAPKKQDKIKQTNHISAENQLQNIVNKIEKPTNISTLQKTETEWNTWKATDQNLQAELQKKKKSFLDQEAFLNRVDWRQHDVELEQKKIHQAAIGKKNI